MSGIDSRVVDMQFNNDRFQKNIGTTMGSLDSLKGKLNFDGSRKSAEELQKSFSNFSLGGLASSVKSAGVGFTTLATIGITALSQITSAAVETGGRVIKALTFGPALGGLKEYETNLNSIQTVLANTSSKGTTLDQVNAALDQLNTYSDKTIYNFSEMARNIGTFTAAGVDLDTSVSAIKGIANLAALSGSDSNQASSAMYQLSQALSTGTVKLQDWNSVVNAGMGGEVFQDALKDTAKVHGVAVDKIIKDEGSFRDSLQKGWLTADILNETLSKFTGDLTEEQLKAMGYNKDQIASVLKMGQTATDAATKVKTASQLIGTLQETVGSGWSKTFQIVFGDFEEAKDLFTGINNVLGGIIGQAADTRNALLQGWKDLGGRTVLIEAFWNVLNSGKAIIDAIKGAFREIFPKKTSQDLYNFTVAFRDFTKRILDGTANLAPFIRILKGFFAIISIGWGFVKALGSAIFELIGTVTKGSGGFLNFVGGIADWIVALDAAIKKGDLFNKFFDKLGEKISLGIAFIKRFVAGIAGLFNGVDFGNIGSALARVFDDLKSGAFGFNSIAAVLESVGLELLHVFENIYAELQPLGKVFSSIWDGLVTAFNKARAALQPLIDSLKDIFSTLFSSLFGAVSDGDFGSLLEVITTGALAGIFLALKKFLKDGLSLNIGGGVLDSIKESFEGLTGVLTGMQTQIKAKTLMNIAIAVGILTLSIVALSNIDADKLAKSLSAIAVGMGQLVGAMAILAQIGTTGSVIKIPIIAAGMVLLAGAVFLLSLAVKSMSKMSWEELGKGMAGVAAGITLLVGAMAVLNGISGGLVRAGVGMIAISLALIVLSKAVKSFAGMDWETMGKGMAGVAVGLGLITAAMRLMPTNILANAVGLVIIAGALKVLATAVSTFGGMDWVTMGKGMAGIAASLLIIAGAMQLMPKDILAQSVALIAVGVAMNILAKAIGTMGGMSWEEIGKGMAALAGGLGILAVALKIMSGTVTGAIALGIVVAALALFVPVLITLGNLSWQVILTGLGALAGIFLVVGLAGLALAPITPILLALSLAMLAFGAGTFLFGAGALLAANAIAILVAAGAAGMAILTQVLEAIIGAIPAIIVAIGEGIIQFAGVIEEGAPAIIDAFVAIMSGLLDAVVELAPKIAKAVGVLIDTILGVLKDNTPKIIQAGFDLLIDLLDGIANNIGKVTDSVTNIITEFLKALGESIPKIIQAGVDMIVSIIEGVAKGLKDNIQKLINAGADLVEAIVEGIIGGLGNVAQRVINKFMEWVGNIWDNILGFFGIASPSKKFFWVGEMLMTGLSNGVDANGQKAVNSVESTGQDMVDTMSSSLSKIPSILDGIADMNPTITPVLDLTSVKTEAGKLGDMFATPAIDLAASFSQARAISQTEQQTAETQATAPESEAKVLKFEQNNYSPEALSPVEIYRRTRNQLAMAKEALGV